MENGENDENAKNIALLAAAYSNDFEECERLVEEEGANVNFQDHDGQTALMYACSEILLRTAKTLVSLGADVNIQDNNGNTALIQVCLFHPNSKNLINFVKFLLKSGANANIKGHNNDSVLDIVKKFFTNDNPNKEKIIDILEKWPTTMGILALNENGTGIEDSDLFQYMGQPIFDANGEIIGYKGGKNKLRRRKSRKNKRKSRKNKSKRRK